MIEQINIPVSEVVLDDVTPVREDIVADNLYNRFLINHNTRVYVTSTKVGLFIAMMLALIITM